MEGNIDAKASSSSSSSSAKESGSYEISGDGLYFVKSTHPGTFCSICGDDSVLLISCKCNIEYCESCLRSYFSFKMKQFDCFSVKCPNQTCFDSSKKLARASLSTQDFTKFNNFRKSLKHLRDPKVVFCSTPDCQGVSNKTKTLSTCKTCRVDYMDTIDPGRLEILTKLNVVECPDCFMLISTSFGCLKTRCICGCDFCAKCGKQEIDSHCDWKCSLSDNSGKVSWMFIALLLYLPAVFPFSPMILVVAYHYNWNRKYFTFIEEHPVFYFFIFLIFSPVIFVFSLFFFPLIFAGICVEALFGFKSAFYEGAWLVLIKILIYFPAAFLAFIGFLLLVALVVSFAPLFGIVLVLAKLKDPKEF